MRKTVEVKLERARGAVQRGVDENFWPSVIKYLSLRRQRQTTIVKETHQKKMMELSEREDRPLGKQGEGSVRALDDVKLRSWVQQVLPLGPKHPVRNKFNETHFLADIDIFLSDIFLADIKHPRHEEALSGVKASKARLLREAEARRKEKPQELATKKMQAVTEETCEPEPVTAADDFKIDYTAAARDALNRVQQELVTKEIEQKLKLELENEKIQERLNAFEASEVEETKAPNSLSMKLNVMSGQMFGMVSQGSKIQSIISVAGHQVIRNLSEPSEFTLMHLDTYADYLRQVETRTESRAVRALL